MMEGQRINPLRERFQVVALRMKIEGFKVIPTLTEPPGFYVRKPDGARAPFTDEGGFILAEKAAEIFKEQLTWND